MKILQCEQGSPEWLRARLSIPTASHFHKIVTPVKGEYSKQSRDYAFFLVAQTLLHESLDSLYTTEWIERGRELEPQAARMYEFEQEVVTEPIGFITTDDGRIGATPDRVVAVDGRPLGRAVEIKCPAPHTHVKYWIDGFGADYRPQSQGHLLVGDVFETVDRYSYHPLMPPVHDRAVRDEPYIKTMRDALERFLDERDEMLEHIRASGYFEEHKTLRTGVDRDLADYLGA